jgi:very-short-patch-repair endonuclease
MVGMRHQNATPDLATANLAARQHGVVSFRQLLAIGLTASGVTRRVRSGRLHRVHRGVYAVGHSKLTREGSWLAAALACGEGAVVSHRSAAALWGLLEPGSGVIDVSVPGVGGKGRRDGIRLHRSRSLTPEFTTRRQGIPITTPARTISDLRRIASAKTLHRAIRQANVLGLPIAAETLSDRTNSELERLFLRLCRRHDLPTPEVNVWIDVLEVDFLWRDRQLVVETDGYRYHRGRAAFEDDRNRDLRLRALGYEVIRLTYRQLVDEPEQIANVLRILLKPGHAP